MKNRTSLDYNFEEFISWSVSHILFGIGRGETLRSLVTTIVDHAMRNEVFGGQKINSDENS